MQNKARKENKDTNSFKTTSNASKPSKGRFRRSIDALVMGAGIAGTLMTGIADAKGDQPEGKQPISQRVQHAHKEAKGREGNKFYQAVFSKDAAADAKAGSPGLNTPAEKNAVKSLDQIMPKNVPASIVYFCGRGHTPLSKRKPLNYTKEKIVCGGQNPLLQVTKGKNAADVAKNIIWGQNKAEPLQKYFSKNLNTDEQKNFVYRVVLEVSKRNGQDLMKATAKPGYSRTAVSVPLEAWYAAVQATNNIKSLMPLKNGERMKKVLQYFPKPGAKKAQKSKPKAKISITKGQEPEVQKPKGEGKPEAKPETKPKIKVTYEGKEKGAKPEVKVKPGVKVSVAKECSFDALGERYKKVRNYVRSHARDENVKEEATKMYLAIAADCPAEKDSVVKKVSRLDELVQAELEKKVKVRTAKVETKGPKAKVSVKAGVKSKVEAERKKKLEDRCANYNVDRRLGALKAEVKANYNDKEALAKVKVKYSKFGAKCAKNPYARKQVAKAISNLPGMVKKYREMAQKRRQRELNRTRVILGDAGLLGYGRSNPAISAINGHAGMQLGNLKKTWSLNLYGYGEGGSNAGNAGGGFDWAKGGILGEYSRLRLGVFENFKLSIAYHGSSKSLDTRTTTSNSGSEENPTVTETPLSDGTRTDRDWETQTTTEDGKNSGNSIGLEMRGTVPLKGRTVKGMKVKAGIGYARIAGEGSTEVNTDHENRFTEDRSDPDATPAIVNTAEGGSSIDHRYTSNQDLKTDILRANLGLMFQLPRNLDVGFDVWMSYARTLANLTQGESGTQTFLPTSYTHTVGGVDISDPDFQRDPKDLSRNYDPSSNSATQWNLVPMARLSWNGQRGAVDLAFGADIGKADSANGLSANSMFHGYMLALGRSGDNNEGSEFVYGVNGQLKGPHLSARGIVGYADYQRLLNQFRLENDLVTSTSLPLELMQSYLQNTRDHTAETMPGFSLWGMGGADVNLEAGSADPVIYGAVMQNTRHGPYGVTVQYDHGNKGVRATGVLGLTNGFRLRGEFMSRKDEATEKRVTGGGASVVYAIPIDISKLVK